MLESSPDQCAGRAPKKLHAEARTLLCAMTYAETQAACEALREQFTTRYRKLAPKAVERLAEIGKGS